MNAEPYQFHEPSTPTDPSPKKRKKNLSASWIVQGYGVKDAITLDIDGLQLSQPLLLISFHNLYAKCAIRCAKFN
jgi:hypothetical protein